MNIERLKKELLAQRGACAADSTRKSTSALIPDYTEEY